MQTIMRRCIIFTTVVHDWHEVKLVSVRFLSIWSLWSLLARIGGQIR